MNNLVERMNVNRAVVRGVRTGRRRNKFDNLLHEFIRNNHLDAQPRTVMSSTFQRMGDFRMAFFVPVLQRFAYCDIVDPDCVEPIVNGAEIDAA